MQSGTSRRAAVAAGRDAWRVGRRALMAALLASCVAACQHDGRDGGPYASMTTGVSGATIAFESIDGPPMAVFNKLVDSLSAEADARQVPVVSREGPADYRVRGYLAAHVDRKNTTIAWVFDVYDRRRQRALRITGEEAVPGRRTVRDAWTVADERLLHRIAQASMNNLIAFVGPGAAQTAIAQAPADAASPSVAAALALAPIDE